MRKRNLIGAAAFSVALAGGGVAGAMLGTPGVSGAQDGTTSTTTEQPANTTDAARPRPPRPGARLELKAAADALGITPEELRTELQAGKSIADVATEKNVELSKVTDAMVTEGTAKLQEMIDKLPDRVDEAVQRKGLPAHPDGPGGRGGPRPDGEKPADAPKDDADTTTTADS